MPTSSCFILYFDVFLYLKEIVTYIFKLPKNTAGCLLEFHQMHNFQQKLENIQTFVDNYGTWNFCNI